MSRQEKYYGSPLSIGDPSGEPYAITPSDDTDIPQGVPNYLYVGVAGVVSMFFARTGGTLVLDLVQGYHLFRPTRINATGTTAGQVVGMFDGVS